jgi:hypothetical protein
MFRQVGEKKLRHNSNVHIPVHIIKCQFKARKKSTHPERCAIIDLLFYTRYMYLYINIKTLNIGE